MILFDDSTAKIHRGDRKSAGAGWQPVPGIPKSPDVLTDPNESGT